MGNRKTVGIESPLKGDWERNIRYARLCALDSLRRGEAPYGSHLFFPQFLNDTMPDERNAGMVAGAEIADAMSMRAFYIDFGQSDGMIWAYNRAKQIGQNYVFRCVDPQLLALLRNYRLVDELATPGVLGLDQIGSGCDV